MSYKNLNFYLAGKMFFVNVAIPEQYKNFVKAGKNENCMVMFTKNLGNKKYLILSFIFEISFLIIFIVFISCWRN